MKQALLPVRAVTLGHFDAELAQQLTQEPGVRQARHIGQQQGLIRQDRGGHQLDGGVLGAADGNVPEKLGAALNGDAVHDVLKRARGQRLGGKVL